MTSVFETEDDRLSINVSGTHYEIYARDLFNFPDTLLGDPWKRARYLVPGQNEYFFPRHSSSFESILYYYINDAVLIKSETVPALVIHKEMEFFQLSENLTRAFYQDYLSMHEEASRAPNPWWKRTLWHSLLHPPTTRLSCLFSALSAVFNALAIYSVCLETMNVYRNLPDTTWMITHTSKPTNRSVGFQCSDISVRPYHFVPRFTSENALLELICITWLVRTKGNFRRCPSSLLGSTWSSSSELCRHRQ